MSDTDPSSADEGHLYEQHHHVGLVLMAFSSLGIVLGSVMLLLGLAQDAFLNGPSTLGIGIATLGAGISLRSTGARTR